MPWSEYVGLAGFLLACATGYGTYRISKQKENIADRVSAIDGFDKLTEDQRIELQECKKELRETRTELHTAEGRIHEQDNKIHELEREVVSLKRQVAILEGKP